MQIKFQTIFITIIILLYWDFCSAQVIVKEDQRVGIHQTNNYPCKLLVANNEWDYTMRIQNNKDAGTAQKYGLVVSNYNEGTGNKYGIHNTVTGNVSSTKTWTGLQNDVHAYGSNYAARGIGVYNIIRFGNGKKYGVYNYLHNQSTSVSAHAYGSYTYILPFQANAYGHYTRIIRKTNSRSAYGNHTWIQDNLTANNFKNYVNYSRLDHEGNADSYGDYIYINSKGTAAQGETGTSYGTYIDVKGVGDTERIGIYADINGGTGFAGQFVGNVCIDGELTCTSDESLKENIKPINDALGIIQNLAPKSYNFKKEKGHGNDPDKERFGFLAGELEKILPDLVSKVNNFEVITEIEKGRRPIVNEDANSIGLESENNFEIPADSDYEVKEKVEKVAPFSTINYIDIIPILTQAIKEQQIEIDALKVTHKEEMTELKKAVQSLQKEVALLKKQ